MGRRMVDSLILLATGLACIYVAIVAAYRDQTTPWFQTEAEPNKTPPADVLEASRPGLGRNTDMEGRLTGWRARRDG